MTVVRAKLSGFSCRPARIERRFVLALPAARAFDLFSDPQRLDSFTPGWFQLEVCGALPHRLDVGAHVDYRLRWRLMTFRWRSVITEWRPPSRLIYEQARGPYRSFRHLHLLRPVPGGTEIVDRIDFEPPIGSIITPLVRSELGRILDYRAARAEAMAPDV